MVSWCVLLSDIGMLCVMNMLFEWWIGVLLS